VKLKFRVVAALLAAFTLSSLPASSKGSSEGQLVDSGSFGIFRQGRRIGTETFTIHQQSDFSVTASQLKIEDGNDKATQSSELKIASNGDLRHYEWKELTPEKAQATVDYQDQFLTEHITVAPGAKPREHAFMLPASTVILDDFFIHREVLLWRYLASYCGTALQGCKLQASKFGVVIPHQQVSTTISVNYDGPEKVAFHGAERELNRFTLQSEDGATWTFWVDSSYPFKLLRILVPSENVEVVRD